MRHAKFASVARTNRRQATEHLWPIVSDCQSRHPISLCTRDVPTLCYNTMTPSSLKGEDHISVPAAMAPTVGAGAAAAGGGQGAYAAQRKPVQCRQLDSGNVRRRLPTPPPWRGGRRRRQYGGLCTTVETWQAPTTRLPPRIIHEHVGPPARTSWSAFRAAGPASVAQPSAVTAPAPVSAIQPSDAASPPARRRHPVHGRVKHQPRKRRTHGHRHSVIACTTVAYRREVPAAHKASPRTSSS